MDKISIIIPAFNVEPYIRKCLDSIINQNHKNIEILLINDGSTDGTGHICSEYASKDKRIHVFRQDNLGLSTALNVGLAHVTGDYICFADSDDWVEPDWCDCLYQTARAASVPISISGFFVDTDVHSTAIHNHKPIPPGAISAVDMLLYPLKRDAYQGFCGYVWNKLFSSQAIKTSGLRFDEDIKYGMDLLFYISLVLTQHCIGAYVDKPLYHYYQRNASISKSIDYDIKLDILTVYKRVETMLNNNGYEHLSFWARGFYCHHAGVIAEIAHKRSDAAMLKQMQDKINRHLDDYIKTNKAYPYKFERMYALLKLLV